MSRWSDWLSIIAILISLCALSSSMNQTRLSNTALSMDEANMFYTRLSQFEDVINNCPPNDPKTAFFIAEINKIRSDSLINITKAEEELNQTIVNSTSFTVACTGLYIKIPSPNLTINYIIIFSLFVVIIIFALRSRKKK